MKYNLTDKKLIEEGNEKDIIIEKHGYVPTFTLRQLEDNVTYTQKNIKELTAKRDFEQAKISNVEHHHPFVKDVPEFDRYVIHTYQEAAALVKACDNKLAELETQLNEDKAELADILEQIPELAEKIEDTPSPYTPEVIETPEAPSADEVIQNDESQPIEG